MTKNYYSEQNSTKTLRKGTVIFISCFAVLIIVILSIFGIIAAKDKADYQQYHDNYTNQNTLNSTESHLKGKTFDLDESDTATENTSSDGAGSGSVHPDYTDKSYNPQDYTDAEDYYYDTCDDFMDYEEAEDYWNDEWE